MRGDAVTPTEARLLLSEREWQVAKLANKGKKVKVIATELGLAEGTVKRYLSTARKKLGKNFRNYNLFGVEAPRGVPVSKYPINWKNNGFTDEEIERWSKKKCGRELLEWEIRTGKASMAFKHYAQGDVCLSGEVRLASAINGLGDRNYLMKKRAEARKALTLSARYKVVKISQAVIKENKVVQDVINQYKLPVVKTDLPGLEKGDTSEYSYVCKTDKEFNMLVGAIVNIPGLSYDKISGKVIVKFDTPKCLKCIRLKRIIGERYSLVAYRRYQSQKSRQEFEISVELGSGTYVVSVQFGNGAEVDYSLVVD